MLFAISDVVWQALIGAIVTIVLAWMQRKTRDAVLESAEAHKERSDVIEKKLDENTKVGKITHDLANSAMLGQKRLMADTAKALAESTGKPEDSALATAAEMAYQEHLAGQEKSDAKELAANKVLAAAKLAEQKNTEPPQPMH